MMRMCLLLLITIGVAIAQDVTVDLSTVTLSEQTQKALKKYAAEKEKAEQDYRKKMMKLRATVIQDLEKQLKRGDNLQKLAIQARIDEIKKEEINDMFGTPIKKPFPAKLQHLLDGQEFTREGGPVSYTINGDKAIASSGSRGDVTVLEDHFKIAWNNGTKVTVQVGEDGEATITRTKGDHSQTYKVILIEKE